MASQAENDQFRPKLTLVYLIHALLHADGGEELEQASTTLSQIASTVEFAPDAPTDLNSLWGNHHRRLTIEQNIELLEESRVEEPACDIVCRDAAAIREMESRPVDPQEQEYPPDPAFEQLERQYRERLGIPTEDQPPSEASADPAELRSPDVLGRRKALTSQLAYAIVLAVIRSPWQNHGQTSSSHWSKSTSGAIDRTMLI